jgi:hypothetical protein
MGPCRHHESFATHWAISFIPLFGPPILVGNFHIACITATTAQWKRMKCEPFHFNSFLCPEAPTSSFIPKLRSDLHVDADGHDSIGYKEYIGDTPLYTCIMLVCQQLVGFPLYLLFNISGQPRYPKWTSHINRMPVTLIYLVFCHSPRNTASSVIFSQWHRNSVMFSNAGILFMAGTVMCLKETCGAAALWKYYGIPWMAVTHWVSALFINGLQCRFL